ncbi:MAG: heavy metal-binding domain-containing protein, partial [Candidatus Marinimicrobia bacterium]|nr:heavy metal-binding domain-containing protein [Candidatus Neomarinimicrobiota bacterium]
MIVSTQNQLDGYQVVETLGLVQGSTIRARHIGTDILAGLRNIVGGEVHEYTKMLAESREQSLDRMIANAEEAGANAVLCMRF